MGMPRIWTEHDECSREKAITNIIQSVALQETALAHMLNAEGEKMQAIINGHHVSTEELFELNKSVERFVNSVTRLEMMLQAKLELFDLELKDVR